MGTQRERFEAFYRLRKARNPDEESAVLGAADAFDASMARGSITPAELETLVSGASSPRTGIWMSCTDFLGAASARWAEAAQAIIAMMRSPKAGVRFNALCCLVEGTPSRITEEVVRLGLRDKSARLHWKAAQQASDLGCRGLVPDLEAALRAEANAKARASIGLSLALLRDGYLLETSDDGSYTLSVKVPSGITLVSVAAEEIEKKGAAAVAAEIRASRSA